jgi:hypothetical protein
MATAPNRCELFLDHERVFIKTPPLVTDDELAGDLAVFVAEVRVAAAGGAGSAARGSRPVRKIRDRASAVTSHFRRAGDHAAAINAAVFIVA